MAEADAPGGDPDVKPGKKKRNKKKRGRSSAASEGASQGDDSTILNSGLSLKKRLFLKKLARRTPWYDADELIEAGRGLLLAVKLFPSPPPVTVNASIEPNAANQMAPPLGLTIEEYHRLQTALRRVALWRGRSERVRLPHAIDVTAGLAGVLLSDAEQTDATLASGGANATTPHAATPHQLRNAYASLLLRSVNGLADSYRSKSAAMSVSHACALAGMPAWIVDVRHDASHGELPGLGACRVAAIESLRFWGEGYWRGAEGRVRGRNTGAEGGEGVGIFSLAAETLERYRTAAEAEAREREERARKPPLAATGEKEGSADAMDGREKTECEEEEDVIPIPSAGAAKKKSTSGDGKKRAPEKAPPERRGGGPIPWWVLDDDKPKKKKKKRDKADDDGDEENDTGGATKETVEATAPGADARPSASTDIPPAAPSARDCAAEFVRTIPIDIAFSTALRFLVWGGDNSGPALATLPPDSGLRDFDESFERLCAICEPLLIAVTNAYPGFVSALFVHLADSILCLDEALPNQQDTDGGAEGADGSLDLQQLDRTIRSLVRWVRHILSRQFHMHFDRSVALYHPSDLQANDEATDLKKKRRTQWTSDELKYMQSPLDFASLDQIGLPMNSVCDRLLSHQKASNAGAAVGELQQFLEGIIGESRVVFMGLGKETGEREHPLEERDDGGASEDEQPAMLSLEDMEAMLGNAKGDGDHSKASAPSLGTEKDGTATTCIPPWTLCERWDSCAIGTMPGYPG